MNGESDLIGKPRQTKIKLICGSEQDKNVIPFYFIYFTLVRFRFTK